MADQQSGQAESFAVNSSGEVAVLVNRNDKSKLAFGEEYRGLYVLRAGGLAREATYGEAVTVTILSFLEFGFAPTLAAVAVMTLIVPTVLIGVVQRLFGVGDFLYEAQH